MTLRRLAVCCVLGAVLLGLAPTADATVAPPVRIRWIGPTDPGLAAGKVSRGAFEVTTGAPGLLEDLRIEGDGWSVEPLAAPDAIVLAGGARRTFEFRATPADPKAPLVVRARFGGREVQQTFRLDPEWNATARVPGPLAFASGKPRVGEGSTLRPQGTSIRFRGRVTYRRSDNLEIGADSITVRIMDDDSPDPFDEEIWSGHTDTNGYFDVTVEWDDCDVLGCDNPDIYVLLETVNAVIDVQKPDILQTTYAWSSENQVIDDYTGTDLDFGVMQPGDPSEFGAVHVFNSMRRAWRHAWERAGAGAPMVEIRWPSGDGTNYSNDRINIEDGETWKEGTQVHEFGHHVHEHFGDLSHYDDGNDAYCGDGHCVWCPESESVAFAEGFADWFGYSVMAPWNARYGVTPLWINDARYTLEQPENCSEPPNAYFPDSLTEGFTGALLRDIEDAGNDDHDGGAPDCDMDVMTLGDDEIYTVVLGDEPWTIRQFIDAFRARYPQVDQDFWSTTRNVAVSFGFPITPPLVTTQANTCRFVRAGETLALAVQGNGSLLQYRWRKDGTPLADGGGFTGSASPNLTLSPVAGSMSGTYQCLVGTCDGTYSTMSLPIRVTVQSATPPRPALSWGENGVGQVGNGTISPNEPPMAHPGIADMIAAAGGRGFTIALRANGSVLSWGQSQWGELGHGFAVTQQNTPLGIAGLSNVMQIAAGRAHAMALDRDGLLWGWGYNGYGQLGDSSEAHRATPVRSRAVPGCVRAVACGEYHTLALLADGTVLAWGSNDFGALGRGTSGGWSSQPQAVPGLTNVEAISAAGFLNLALKTDGTVWAWGWNQNGALGIGSFTSFSSTPVQVSSLPVIRKIAAGAFNGYAISNTGAVYSWGSGGQGVLGNSNPLIAEQRTPALITTGLTLPLQIVTGNGGWAAALESDGTIKVWGYNYDRPLGRALPSGDGIWTPTIVNGVTGVSQIGAGWGTLHAAGSLAGVTGADDEVVPARLALHASPNPSFAATRLSFELPRRGRVSLAVYDVTGRLVRTLASGERAAGRWTEAWDGRETAGGARRAGVYFARLELDGEVLTERLVRLP